MSFLKRLFGGDENSAKNNEKNNKYSNVKRCNSMSLAELGAGKLQSGDRIAAKNMWIDGIKLINEDYYDNLGVGMCISNFTTNFAINDIHFGFKLTEIGCLLLGKSIYYDDMTAGYKYRAQLLTGHEVPMVVQGLLTNKGGFGQRQEIYFISDYYLAGKSNSEDIQMLQHAQGIHNWLEETTIEGRAANTYTLEEFVKIGVERHRNLFSNIESDYPERIVINSDEIELL